MGIENDVSGIVSSNLSTIIETELNNPDTDQPVTLGSVYNAMNHGMVNRLIDDGHIDAVSPVPLFEEIKNLIEDYGGYALAKNFIHRQASENLAIVIQTELDNLGTAQPPTLGLILDDMQQGLVAQLVGDGLIDPDEDDTLITEIQHLIRVNGANTPAEEFLG